jgi:hypothetical protein
MLIHIVCWKYKEGVDDTRREDHRTRLAALSQLVPGLARLDVGADILHLDRSFDTALFGEFEDCAALDAYTVHPAHQEVVAIGREIADRVVSVDFYRNP